MKEKSEKKTTSSERDKPNLEHMKNLKSTHYFM